MNSVHDGLNEFNYSQAVYWLDWLETGNMDSLKEAMFDYAEDILVCSDGDWNLRTASCIVGLEDYLHEFADEHFSANDPAIYEQAKMRIDSLGLMLAKGCNCYDDWLKIHVRNGFMEDDG